MELISRNASTSTVARPARSLLQAALTTTVVLAIGLGSLGAFSASDEPMPSNDAPADSATETSVRRSTPPMVLIAQAADAHRNAQRVRPSTNSLLAGYCAAIVLASLAGGVLPSFVNLTHTRLQLLISLVSGLMLGVGLLHQLPHAVSEMSRESPDRALDWCVGWMLGGMMTLFFMLRLFHFHQHEPYDESSESTSSSQPAAASTTAGLPVLQLGEPHDHDHHSHSHAHGPGCLHDHGVRSHGLHRGPAPHPWSWVFLTAGLAIHTLIDGIALASSVEAESSHGGHWNLFGFSTFLAIALHKPLDSLPIASLMSVAGWSRKWRHAVNFGYATMCPIGALVFAFGVREFSGAPQQFVSAALAFSAGAFLCIALSDLLPELEFHSHDRLKLSFTLLLGVATAIGIGWLEPRHAHQHISSAPTRSSPAAP